MPSDCNRFLTVRHFSKRRHLHRQSLSHQTYGGECTIGSNCSGHPHCSAGKNYAFLKFDLTKVLPQAMISSHAKPLNASLWLYADLTTAFNNASVRVYHVLSSDWDENTLTWNSMPPIDESHYEQRQIRGIDMWYYWNVTGDVSGDMQRDGLSSFALISGFTSWMNIAWFASKEYETYQKENVSKSPELDLYFQSRRSPLSLLCHTSQ